MINIDVHSQAVQAALKALTDKLHNPAPVLHEIGEDIAARAKARFDSSTGPDGQKWRPKKKKDGRPPLVGETDNLRRQIVGQVVGSTGGATLTVAATMQYAAIQQFGGTVQRAARQITVAHRTNAKGELLRSAIFGGRGLIFARQGKGGHKRALVRTFDVAAHSINIPARPFMPVRPDGSLYPAEQALIVEQISAWLASRSA